MYSHFPIKNQLEWNNLKYIVKKWIIGHLGRCQNGWHENVTQKNKRNMAKDLRSRKGRKQDGFGRELEDFRGWQEGRMGQARFSSQFYEIFVKTFKIY